MSRAATLLDLRAASDVVSIHLRLGDRSRGLLGAEQLRTMRAGALLINTARSQIVDQAALLQALEQGWIAGAGLDVYDTEPLPSDAALRRAPSVLLTPHLGYVTEDNLTTYYARPSRASAPG